jgi:hypothetical protein
VAAVRADGVEALSALLRLWPKVVPGLKFDTQTEAQLDDINDALWKVEALFGIAFPNADPRANTVTHWSDRWAKPSAVAEPQADMEFRAMLDAHPRKALIRQWADTASKDMDETISERFALTHALYEFAMLPLDDWADEDVTEMLDGTLRVLGFDRGIYDLGHVASQYAPLIMSSAFAITAGNALLLYNEDGKPVVRNIN